MNVYKISKIVVIIIGIIASLLFVSALGMEVSMDNNSFSNWLCVTLWQLATI